RRIKLTGGEPLLQKNLDYFIRELKNTPLLEQITITTNGLLLEDFLSGLGSEAPDLIAGINISLNTTDPAIYAKMARREAFSEALAGAHYAKSLGIPVKLNCVPVRHHNETNLAELARLAEKDFNAVRFIELMPMGVASGLEGIPMAEIIALLEERFGLLVKDDVKMGNGPAEYYNIAGFKGKIGFISAMSHGFCSSCNRLRLSSDGFLKVCLASEAGIDLKALLREGATDEEVKTVITRLAATKPMAHGFAGSDNQAHENDLEPYRGPLGMYRIGG
ncbi:MAG: radical SAM protein, partial [Deltaproteobacteria bacterium]|nr:radical SAM protein [Deltaproteobacteria bacterium]